MEAAGFGVTLRYERLSGDGLARSLADLAQLRVAVFRDWPYLYDGDDDYERRYLADFAASPGAVIVGAFEGERMVGAATASPLADHHDDFADAFRAAGLDVEPWFYLAESVLLADHRGQGAGHAFFDRREAAAREQGFDRACFCAVTRDGPAPEGYRALDEFWWGRGYRPLDGITASFAWREVGHDDETDHEMQFWGKAI